MVEYPNPVLKTVLLRDLAPYAPVWLLGIVLAAVLDAYRFGNSGVPLPTFFEFAVVYSALVGGLLFAVFYRHYRSSPSSIRVEVDGVTGMVPRASGTPEVRTALTLPYASFVAVNQGGFFGPRIVARAIPIAPSGKTVRWEWLHLTPENAVRVADAYRAWQARESPPSLGVVAGAVPN
ncbi:MAG TPA: hypothetical protein VFF67_08530 [Thermoplasmata archaeon]|nr:hypothetical protein [Thermoplasmata archaeon]